MEASRDAQAALAIRNDVVTVLSSRGAAVTQELFNVCYVTAEADLPPIWALLANGTKANAIAQASACVSTRFLASGIQLSPTSIPLVTTQLFDQIFKRNMFAGGGLAMGQGLTPFAIICPNHAEAHAAIRASAAADTVQQPGLDDALTIMTTDVRLPANPYHAMEKLKGWSILLDCVIGALHPVAVATHDFVMLASPAILEYCANVIPIAEAMEKIIALLFAAQQKLFFWLNHARGATTVATRPATPDYSELMQNFTMSTFTGTYPDTWRRHITPAKDQKAAPSATKKVSKPEDNLQPDLVLQKRYQDSGSPALTPHDGGPNQEGAQGRQGRSVPGLGLARKVPHWLRSGVQPPTARCRRDGHHPQIPGWLPRHQGPWAVMASARRCPDVELHSPVGSHSREDPQACA